MESAAQLVQQPVVVVDDALVAVEAVPDVAGGAVGVELSRARAWRDRIRAGRAILDRALEADQPVYGVSTGVGNDSGRRIGRAAQIRHAISIMEQHGCGVGEPLSETESRAVVFARLVSLAKGLSAVRLELLEGLCNLLNHGITPVIPRWGSVGASGDLTPLSYVAAALAGKRKVFYQGKTVEAKKALKEEGLTPYEFGPKETLAIMNGTSVMTAVGILAVNRLAHLVEQAERVSALAAEVLQGRAQAFSVPVHQAKPHPGQVETARRIRTLLKGSRLLDPPARDGRVVQDRYSIRCTPQILGSVRDAIAWAQSVLEVELNSVNDNPLVIPETGEILFGGNFFGGHPALVLDTIKIAAASAADLIDRQFALLVDHNENMGMPETLVPYGGCGVKGLQMTCSALTELAIQRAAPDTTLSRSTECANQDKVSMGLQAAVHASENVTCVARALAAEMIAVSNAARLRDETCLSPSARQLLREIRGVSPVLMRDRPLDADIARLADRLNACETLS